MPDSTRATIVDRLTERLVRASGESGGWPYYEGKQPRIEPTCWALLALAGSGPASTVESDSGLTFLASRKQGNGLLVDAKGLPPNLAANGLAACVLQTGAFARRDLLTPLLAGIAGTRGVAIAQGPSPQDNSLRAWPWVEGTFSWVEPTAWCVLALKKSRSGQPPDGVGARLADGERMLIDRACRGGGWNYGNASMFDQDLRPYVPTTALGVMALQDRGDAPAVREGVAALERHWQSERATLALALVVLAFKRIGRDSGAAEAALADVVPRAERAGHVLGMAMALCALADDSSVSEALRV